MARCCNVLGRSIEAVDFVDVSMERRQESKALGDGSCISYDSGRALEIQVYEICLSKVSDKAVSFSSVVSLT